MDLYALDHELQKQLDDLSDMKNIDYGPSRK
jgi:hypothetical protein